MPLIDSISDIVAKLRQGRFPNEQSISQGIVLRLLQELGWDTWDTNLVWPEFQTGEGRVDFALCYPASKPIIFIEVKQPGRASDGVVQALQYAFHTGVPFVVLTDGKTWSFYLPAEQGSYEDRRVYKLDFFEREPSEAAAILESYLNRLRVESGEAIEIARKEYRSRNRRAQARAAFPEAWRELAEKGDETLIELLSNTVESKAGVRPEEDDVISFIGTLISSSVPIQPVIGKTKVQPSAFSPSIPESHTSMSSGSTRAGNLLLQGKSYSYANAKEAMVIVLRELAKKDPTFLQRCSQHPNNRGRKRAYIARTPEELYPDRQDFHELHKSLPGGWIVATNLNNVLKKSIIRMAAEVAGLSFGRDVSVDF